MAHDGARGSQSTTLEPALPGALGEEPLRPSGNPVAPGAGREGWLPSRGLVIACLLVVIYEVAIGFVPLFGGPGYESSLATGIFVPSVVAVVTAFGIARERREPFDAFCRGVANGAVLVMVALAVVMLHGVRTGLCDVVAGLENFALGPGLGALVAGVWGWLVAEVAGSIKRSFPRSFALTVLALGGPLACALFSVARFYSSPMIFAYDPFVGFFSGSMYDTVVELSGLLTYRAGTAATLFATFVVALHLTHDARGRLAYQSIGRPGLLAAGIAAAIASATLTLSGPALGHYHSRDTIAEALGAAIQGQRCEVVYPRSMPAIEAQRFLRECEAYVADDEAWLGVTGTPRITAFLFRDEAQKASFMGAAGTSIAKPWRHEIYVQNLGFPHHVVGHEVMHVVSGQIGSGPFHVAGALGGWLPNPGLIEGVAVASNPRDDGLSPAEWARAMKDLGILPRLSRLFAFGFFGENSATAYTVSGAFVGFVHDRFGAEAVRRWYAGEVLPKVVGQSWAELEDAWHAELDKLVLPKEVIEQAKAKFDKPSIFGRRCPRTVDACREKSSELASGGDAKGAILELERAAALDPENDGIKLEMAELHAPAGDVDRTLRELEQISSDAKEQQNVRDRAIEALADLELSRGEAAPALEKYQALIGRAFEQSKLRTLHVKAYAAREPKARDAIVALLIGAPGKKPDRVEASALLGQLDVKYPENGLFAYLIARYEIDKQAFDSADRWLDSALARQLDVPQVRVEALRLKVISSCARGDAEAMKRSFDAFSKSAEANASRVEITRRLVDRCLAVPMVGPSAPSAGDR